MDRPPCRPLPVPLLTQGRGRRRKQGQTESEAPARKNNASKLPAPARRDRGASSSGTFALPPPPPHAPPSPHPARLRAGDCRHCPEHAARVAGRPPRPATRGDEPRGAPGRRGRADDGLLPRQPGRGRVLGRLHARRGRAERDRAGPLRAARCDPNGRDRGGGAHARHARVLPRPLRLRLLEAQLGDVRGVERAADRLFGSRGPRASTPTRAATRSSATSSWRSAGSSPTCSSPTTTPRRRGPTPSTGTTRPSASRRTGPLGWQRTRPTGPSSCAKTASTCGSRRGCS